MQYLTPIGWDECRGELCSPVFNFISAEDAVIPTDEEGGTSDEEWSVSPMVWHRPHKSVGQPGDTLHFTAPRRLVAVTVGMTVPFLVLRWRWWEFPQKYRAAM